MGQDETVAAWSVGEMEKTANLRFDAVIYEIAGG
jgi:hypothetical protein